MIIFALVREHLTRKEFSFRVLPKLPSHPILGNLDLLFGHQKQCFARMTVKIQMVIMTVAMIIMMVNFVIIAIVIIMAVLRLDCWPWKQLTWWTLWGTKWLHLRLQWSRSSSSSIVIAIIIVAIIMVTIVMVVILAIITVAAILVLGWVPCIKETLPGGGSKHAAAGGRPCHSGKYCDQTKKTICWQNVWKL